MSQVPIPDDWDGQTWDCAIVEWPASDDWLAILRGLITWPQRGRFWDAETGSILDAQAVGLEIFNRNIAGDSMGSCVDTLASIFNQIIITNNQLVQAAYNTTCGCGGSNGAGISSDEPSSFVDNGTDFPTGYTDRAEYDDAKCDLSQYVIDTLVSDLESLKVVNVAGKSAAALAGLLGLLLLTPVPFDELIAGVAIAILSLVSAGINSYVTALSELSARISAMDICELYGASNASLAVENVEDWIAGGTYTLQSATVQLGQALVGTNAVNVLFDDKSDSVNYGELPNGDCSGCVICPDILLTNGTFGGGNTYDAEFFGVDSSWRVAGRFRSSSVTVSCGSLADFDWNFVSGTFTGQTTNQRKGFAISSLQSPTVSQASDWDIANTDTPAGSGSLSGARTFVLTSSTQFSVDLIVT